MMIVKRWRSGSRLMSLEQVGVDRAVGVGDRQVVLARAFVAGGDLLQRRRQRRAFDPRLGGDAVDVLLADQALGADRAAGVAAEVLEAGVADAEHDGRLGRRRGFDRFDGADFDGGDVDVLPGDDVARVVEDRAHAVGRCWSLRRRSRAARRRPARRGPWLPPPRLSLSSPPASPSSPSSFLAV